MNNPNKKKPPETIEVQRRRQGGSSGPDSQARADAPRRRTDSQGGGTRPSSGGGYTSSSGGGGPTGDLLGILLNLIMKGKLPVWAIALLIIAAIAFFIFSSQLGGDLGAMPPVDEQGNTNPIFPDDSAAVTAPPGQIYASRGQS